MAESVHLNSISVDHEIQYRNKRIPLDYHCTCDYCRKGRFLGEIYNNDVKKYYSNRIRKGYYHDTAGDHLDVGHMIGYRFAIQQLTQKGDWVLDPTVGTGTTIVEAINNGRNGVGIELEYPQAALKNIMQQKTYHEGNALFRQGNACNIDEYLDQWGFEKNKSFSLIINGTPYPKLSGKSSDAPERKNLATGEDKSFDYLHEDNMGLTKGDEYWNLVKTMYGKSIEYLKPGGFFVIIIKDMIQNKKPYLLHKMIIDNVLENNSNMKLFGMFMHRHVPSTMFMNTYPKRFPNILIPFYQTGIVLQKN